MAITSIKKSMVKIAALIACVVLSVGPGSARRVLAEERTADPQGLYWNDLTLQYTVLHVRHHDEKAVGFAEKAVKIAEESFGPDHPNVAQSLNDLGFFYQALHRYPEAEAAHRRALAIREQSGKFPSKELKDAALVQSLHNLGMSCQAQGRFADAEPLYKRSIGITSQLIQHPHPQIAAELDALAVGYAERGDATRAEALFQEALRMRAELLGADDPRVAETMEHYAALLRKAGRIEEAGRLETQAAQIRSQQSHPSPSPGS